ncbi:HPr kinase/phosphorylase [Allosphingosinicella deserti]|uniref:Aldolase n=1 Tax=Allosphingosinicella deserti TaxID=2116704 RepID=A0A2P7QPK2_9SPHN|nr:HPr kinase/phosphatase C-terminal domain-containing protein [Sphingomonas deserti]PSJ39880.1 aldolase [Sphingomonas deserti]
MTANMLHASCVAIEGRAVLVAGRSGSGKSDLALRLIDRGARLVSDDYTELCARDGRLLAAAPERIAGKLEVRGIGIVDLEPLAHVPVALLVDLDLGPERMPDAASRSFAGIEIPVIGLAALEASAPIKVESALLRFGLPLS